MSIRGRIGGSGRAVNTLYCRVNNASRKVKEGYVRVNGTSRLFYKAELVLFDASAGGNVGGITTWTRPGTTPGTANANINSSRIYLDGYHNSGAGAYPAANVDVTNYSTLKAVINISQRVIDDPAYENTTYGGIAIGGEVWYGSSARTVSLTTGSRTLSLDISRYTGKQYVEVGIRAGVTGRIAMNCTKFWLE